MGPPRLGLGALSGPSSMSTKRPATYAGSIRCSDTASLAIGYGVITRLTMHLFSISSDEALIARIEMFVEGYNKTKSPFN
jgi:hypothetical protein